jgi:hypothetical protein
MIAITSVGASSTFSFYIQESAYSESIETIVSISQPFSNSMYMITVDLFAPIDLRYLLELVYRSRLGYQRQCYAIKKKREEKCQGYKTRSRLLVNLVKGSGVVEAAIPDFVDNSSSVCIVLAAWSIGD